jgi:hypothetical protein
MRSLYWEISNRYKLTKTNLVNVQQFSTEGTKLYAFMYISLRHTINYIVL